MIFNLRLVVGENRIFYQKHDFAESQDLDAPRKKNVFTSSHCPKRFENSVFIAVAAIVGIVNNNEKFSQYYLYRIALSDILLGLCIF
jgi:hypothetical protein